MATNHNTHIRSQAKRALPRRKAAVALEGEPGEYIEEGLHSRSPVQTPDSILQRINQLNEK
jgi:hypothetical protein